MTPPSGSWEVVCEEKALLLCALTSGVGPFSTKTPQIHFNLLPPSCPFLHPPSTPGAPQLTPLSLPHRLTLKQVTDVVCPYSLQITWIKGSTPLPSPSHPPSLLSPHFTPPYHLCKSFPLAPVSLLLLIHREGKPCRGFSSSVGFVVGVKKGVKKTIAADGRQLSCRQGG